MLTTHIILICSFFICLSFLLIYIGKKTKPATSDQSLDYFILGLAVISIVVSLFLVALNIATSPFWKWNSSRLAWPLSLFYGYKLYYGYGDGPFLARMYGPIASLIYLPAGLAKIPSTAIIIGSLTSAGLYFLPMVFISIDKIRQNRSQSMWVLCAAGFFALITFFLPSLKYVAFSIHADAPAIAFAVLACICLQISPGKSRWPYFLCSALFCTFAVFSKYTLLPLFCALPAYVFLSGNKKDFFNYLFCLAITFLIALTALSLFVDLRDLFFNIYTIPARQPFTNLDFGHMEDLVWEFYHLPGAFLLFILSILAFNRTKVFSQSHLFLRKCVFMLITLAVVLPILVIYFIDFKLVSTIFCKEKFFLYLVLVLFYIFFIFIVYSLRELKNAEMIFAKHPWIIFLMSGIALFPVSVTAFLKIGGDINNIAPFTCFVAFGIALALVDLFSSPDLFTPSFKRIAKVFLIIILICLMRSGISDSLHKINLLKSFSNNVHDVAYRYAKENPGKTYFPELSLSNLLADKRLYHSLDGISDRLLARFLIRPSSVFSHVPPDVRIIAFVSKSGLAENKGGFDIKRARIKYSERVFNNLFMWKSSFDRWAKLGKEKEALICLEEIIRLEPLNQRNWEKRKEFLKVNQIENSREENSIEFPANKIFSGFAEGNHSDTYIYLMSFFPEFEMVSIAELPGFVVFRRNGMINKRDR